MSTASSSPNCARATRGWSATSTSLFRWSTGARAGTALARPGRSSERADPATAAGQGVPPVLERADDLHVRGPDLLDRAPAGGRADLAREPRADGHPGVR